MSQFCNLLLRWLIQTLKQYSAKERSSGFWGNGTHSATPEALIRHLFSDSSYRKYMKDRSLPRVPRQIINLSKIRRYIRSMCLIVSISCAHLYLKSLRIQLLGMFLIGLSHQQCLKSLVVTY